jgi:putative hydrolase of HD superfamily
MKNDLNKLLDFVKFTHEIRNVQRAILLENYDRHENDAEHGYQLALVTWFLLDKHRLKLDKYRCVGMAMVHDIAEAYAGDTTAFASAKQRSAQEKREKEAIVRLQKEWPEFTSMNDLIGEYEKHETPEGKFVYALDKLIPIINNYLYEGKVWLKENRTLDHMKEIKKGKIEPSPIVDKYYQELLKILEKQPELFGKPGQN